MSQPKPWALYQAWIGAWLRSNDPYGQCARACNEMLVDFPHLHITRGHYLDPIWGEREHWWLVDTDGSIVDPTGTQFPSKGSSSYRELDPNAPEPIGRCMNCGAYTYEEHNSCSAKCTQELKEYYGRLP